MTDHLCPAQRQALDQLISSFPVGNVFVLSGAPGVGKTIVLREVNQRVGGVFLGLKDFIDRVRERHPLALEETFEQMVMETLREHESVIVDDLHLLYQVTHGHAYPRAGLLPAPLTVLCAYAAESGKKLIFGAAHGVSDPVNSRAYSAHILEFKVPDYQSLCQTFLGEELAAKLDYEKIFRFASRLNAHQLKSACLWLGRDEDLDTVRFIDYLRSRHLVSNVDLGEVQAVDIRDLKGVDDVIQSLEANIVLPLENDDLAAELGLKPKRGVLLAGPPGTGKTTIGRALAHRLKSKFFLIDGTFISGTNQFYARVHHVFEAAKQNAPSIIFIDDSDAIFESGEELGLYRYLLTMLDGLESQSAARVCVMMTAMDVGHLPPALIRSGRIELWLEMRLPNSAARFEILAKILEGLPAGIKEVEVERLVTATEGFTGADLKRLIEDGKTLYAFDRVRKASLRAPTDYFLAAVESVQANKQRYAQAEARARQQRPSRPTWYGMGEGMFSVTEFGSEG